MHSVRLVGKCVPRLVMGMALVGVGAMAPVAGAFDLKEILKKPRDLLPVGSAILGGAACNKFFDGKDKRMATAICAAGAGWLGSQLKQYLNEREKAQLAEATYKTMETGRKESVKSDEGTQMTTEVVTAPTPAPAPPAASQPATAAPAAPPVPAPEAECRTVRQTIVLKNGEQHQEDLTACKKDGKWVPQEKR